MRKILLTFLVLSYTLAISAEEKPNIVLLFVDDLGWNDLGYRNEVFHTPNIDQLKEDGIDFPRAYISTPTCSPSRASLLTGKEAVRMQMVRHIPGNKKFNFDANGRTEFEFSQWPDDPVQMPTRNWLPLEEITYAERLRDLGYYNAFVGKWHLGQDEYHPIMQGFDEQIGTSNFGHPSGGYYQPFFKENNPLSDVPKGKYLTNVLTDKSVNFINNYDKEKPFMLSLWYYNVHGPFVGRKDLVSQYLDEGLTGKYANHAAQVTAMDESVGRIRANLKEKGIADNTVIIFYSDQGGHFSNAPLSGGKSDGNTLGEGGCRVPFIIYYPEVTEANTVCRTPIQNIDLYPTLIEIASGKKCRDSQINGVSLMPLIKGKKIKKRNLYFFRSYQDQYAAMISGEWKLKAYHSGKYELYNLKNDEGEHHDLISSELDIAKDLKQELAKWEAEAVPSYEVQ